MNRVIYREGHEEHEGMGNAGLPFFVFFVLELVPEVHGKGRVVRSGA